MKWKLNQIIFDKKNMRFLILGIFTTFFSFYILPQKKSNYDLESYLTEDKSLDKKVEEILKL